MSGGPVDVVVVGGGPAGLSAALILGRVRRRVLVLDTDAPANAVSDASHGFLSRDGTPPREIRRVGREQLEPYDGVEYRLAAARSARRLPDGRYAVGLDDGLEVEARRLLLAHGMHYGLPDLDGVAELWGSRVFHCPYCHGWEVRDTPIAVHANGPRAVHQALMVSSLGADVVLLGDRLLDPSEEERERLARAGVGLDGRAVDRIEEHADGLQVVFADGATLARHALFVQPALSLATDLGPALGADLTEAGSIATDETGKTTVPGLFAAGDAGAAVQSVAVATGTGARAAYAINAELVLEGSAPAD